MSPLARSSSGFTLLEVVIVVAIIGIVASVTLVNIPNWLNTLEARRAVRQVASTLQYVRFRAVSTNLEYRVRFFADGANYLIEKKDAFLGWVGEGFPMDLPSSVVFNRGGGDPVTFPGDAVTFRPDGSLGGLSGGLYFLGGSQARYRITVLSATGRVRLERGWGPYEPPSP
ncbi:MAG: prepilin-type N-terminal cleavage/methylation domain-containing protein [Candidatus Tectomicrobia bacterium]|uniref:Type II secretion system protein H n=1 Tax=Tectimicrobiota bacterium TaxID=2528274 RepID=A0A932GME0_UNCTE|nr:prepilin-type N-terminal cleavage/methylation domain-containing protein [Candidatus Tectomicrobia bacterium]